MLSQIRAGVYETIPGYTISDIKFYVNTSGDSPTQTQLAQVESTDAFGAICPNIKGKGYAGDLTVTYSEVAETLNQPIISASGTVSNNLILGTNINSVTADNPLGTTATDPTWDTSTGTYTTVLLQGAHTTNMKIKCDYTLYNSVSGETINITGATVEVPYQYLQWKPNFKYSYLFKITDEKLYPITFDAVEVTNSDGLAEYITIVNQPSITTFGVVLNNSSEFQNYVTGKDDYQLPSGTDKLDIYATFLQGTTVLTPQKDNDNKANYVKIYFADYKSGATDAEKAEKPITELSVANAIEHTGGLITATDITSDATTYFTTAPAKVTTVPAEDGTTKTIDALKLEGVKTAGKYAVEIVTYEKLATKLTSEQSKVGYYSLSGDTYTKETTGNGDGSTDYYKQVKTYKVITVVATPAP